MSDWLLLCAKSRKRFAELILCVVSIGLMALLSGCGGSGSSLPSNPGPNPQSSGLVSGTVTDINGAPIVGATVTIAGQSTTTTQEGDYQISNITVPAGQNSAIYVVRASKVINGQQWSGQNTIEILNGDSFTSNANVVMSPTSTQATLSGTVRDTNGNPLIGARVFVAPGPVTDQQTGGQYFTSLSSFTAYTDTNGNYTIPALPTLTANGTPTTATYTATASFAGYINQTFTNLTFTAGSNSQLNFTLSPGGSSTLPAITGFDADAFTVPQVATRAANATRLQRAYQAIKNYILKKQGLADHRAPDPRKVVLRYALHTRSAPAGSIVECDLFWDYQQVPNLLGFDILRSPNDNVHFSSIALLRDPLGDRFADQDPSLTPDTIYFYSVAPVDTINFPQNGQEGQPTTPIQVSPLDPINVLSPVSGQTVSATPTLTWTSVSAAGQYTVLVYNQFPDYQSDTNGVNPILQQITSSTSYTITSPLPPGTYYWAVIAQYTPPSSNVGYAFSVSPIGSFVVP
ncbi:carboxypeptidase-like regulatory domain-containing protein [Chthonomonas calidirosea]|uniref:carboxypeptidase-like regulatory domain-containing protein n=1 Tax=Chthonomonas calidirosea TaxID=454171 RepID=UPI0006ECA9BD|nr:carboxypeptidase-like regulatory domain-containing protein [Chthonomonas calidirosea]CEK19457.1 Carboxypeptidase regulatory-like domain [Chthonomonas calidirosea]